MRRLLIVSNDLVGTRMAGPGIRSYHFARELAGRFEVTLLVPRTVDMEIPNVRVVEGGETMTMRELERIARASDAIVAQMLPPRLMRRLAASPTRVIYDLYDPLMMENLALYGHESEPWQHEEYRAGALVQEIALATGDAFICASERQRDLWLGALSVLGRVDPVRHADDPALRTLVEVVPFGLEPGEPRAGGRVLKGIVPGIGEGDRVLLWGGGVWTWLDPLTPIRAVAQLAERRDDVRLYFLGVEHPNPAVPRMEMAGRAVRLAEELGVRDRFVFFNFGWVPYAERAGYLLEADAGISAHVETVEARYAFRTRVLDYLWARLPILATHGDALADLVEREALGATLAPGDVDGWTTAIERVLDAGDEESARRRERIGKVREQFTWPRVVEPLARLAEAEPGPAPSGVRSAALLADRARRRARITLARRGVLGSLRRAGEKAAWRARLLARGRR